MATTTDSERCTARMEARRALRETAERVDRTLEPREREETVERTVASIDNAVVDAAATVEMLPERTDDAVVDLSLTLL